MVALEYAEPINRRLKNDDVDLSDAAERFLAAVVAGNREHFEIAGTKLNKVKVGAAERGV